MANTLTNLIVDAYAALNVVSREQTGLLMAVTRDPRASRLPIGATLRSPVAPLNTAGKDITPAMSIPTRADQTITNVAFTISKQRAFPFAWTDDEREAVDAQGPGFLTIQQQQIAQAIRAAIGEMSADLYATIRKGASRAFGTVGTAPFGTNLGESAQVAKILDDNGAPSSGRTLVTDTTTKAALSTLVNNPLNANPNLALTNQQGVIYDTNGLAFRMDPKITTVTKGTAASATTNSAGYAVGATTLTLAAVGTGTILAGDVVVFAGDTNKYVVATGNTDVSAGGTIVLQEPGLLKAMSAATKTITLQADFIANLAFSQDAVILGTRLPYRQEGDMATMVQTITDPFTGISFELAKYPGYHMSQYELGIAWGQAVEAPRHVAMLLY